MPSSHSRPQWVLGAGACQPSYWILIDITVDPTTTYGVRTGQTLRASVQWRKYGYFNPSLATWTLADKYTVDSAKGTLCDYTIPLFVRVLEVVLGIWEAEKQLAGRAQREGTWVFTVACTSHLISRG